MLSENSESPTLYRQKLAAEQSAAEAAWLAGEQDSMKSRAIAEMMDGILQRKKADPLAGLVKEPWMSLPLKELTAQQLKHLREFEKKVQVQRPLCFRFHCPKPRNSVVFVLEYIAHV
jgi:hypothetical protein